MIDKLINRIVNNREHNWQCMDSLVFSHHSLLYYGLQLLQKDLDFIPYAKQSLGVADLNFVFRNEFWNWI